MFHINVYIFPDIAENGRNSYGTAELLLIVFESTEIPWFLILNKLKYGSRNDWWGLNFLKFLF